MKLLHTADWHVGKTIKGQSRLPEHRAVLADVVRVASDEEVDVVLVTGDLYETAAPSPDAEALVLKTLLDLRDTGAHVIVIAGNHDNAARFDAVRPVFAALGVVVMGAPRRPADGGVVELVGRSGESVRVALVPFLSQRGIVRSAELMEHDAGQNILTYDDRMRRLIGVLCEGFEGDAVNVVAAHCMVSGAILGGGERAAQTYMDYTVGAHAFPAHAHYVALGHLHRTQQMAHGSPVWYSGSPLQVDFGELDAPSNVLVVRAERTTPAVVTPVAVSGGRRLRTVRGTLDQLRAAVADNDDAYLRVFIEGPTRAGLAEDVRELLGDSVVEVRVAV
ncbi:MAG TPA: exonuclease subunit SbcD, partial [Acidimicrobiales bacterium]|nr:exonuclease subunit SbcD [Acidimicrobiales bacterium]